MTVEILWLIRSTVMWDACSRRPRRTEASVEASKALVQSSRIRMFGRRSRALAMERRCFSHRRKD